MNKKETEEYVKERDVALSKLDLDWIREYMGPIAKTYSNDFILLTTHKARYECNRIDATLREESREYLESRGYSRVGGFPWPEKGVLP